MKRWNCLFIISAIIIFFSGCNVQPSHDGFTIVFETMPKLYNDQVYFKGSSVGTIRETSTGGQRVAKLVVDFNSEFIQEAGRNVVFFPRNGRLEVVKLQATMEPMQTDIPLCGFSSQFDLSWFKLKTLISNRAAAAKRRAYEMKTQFENGESS